MNQFLENVTPKIYKDAFNKISNGNSNTIDVELVDRSVIAEEMLSNNDPEIEVTIKSSEAKNPFSINEFEKRILTPVKSLDDLLKKIPSGQVTDKELSQNLELMKEHASLASFQGFQLLAKMHEIIADAFDSMRKGKLSVDKSVIESLRACLIVIVAVVKRKDVDITGYLNRAEEFGNKHLKKNIRV